MCFHCIGHMNPVYLTMPLDPLAGSLNALRGTGESMALGRHLTPEDTARCANEDAHIGRNPDDPLRLHPGRCGPLNPMVSPRSPKTRRLSPIKVSSPRKTPQTIPANVKFGPGTKIHDGSSYSRHGSGGKKGLHKCPSDPGKFPMGGSPAPIPVTVLGYDLDDNLQEVRVKRIVHGPTGQALPVRKGHIRHHSEPSADSPELSSSDELYLKGRAHSKASVVSVNEDWSEGFNPELPTAGSPPRLTPLGARTPSAKVRIPDTITEAAYNGAKKPYVLELDRLQFAVHRGDQSLYTYPSARRLPVTPSMTPSRDIPRVQSDLRLTDCSQDFSPVPRADSPANNIDDEGITMTAKETQEEGAPQGKSILKSGDFNIDESRVRISDDSGVPEDKSGSCSKNSSTNSSTTNLSGGSPSHQESQHKQTEVLTTQRDSKTETVKNADKAPTVIKCISGVPLVSHTCKNASKDNAEQSSKLRTVAKDNAVSSLQKSSAEPEMITKVSVNKDKITVHSATLLDQCDVSDRNKEKTTTTSAQPTQTFIVVSSASSTSDIPAKPSVSRTETQTSHDKPVTQSKERPKSSKIPPVRPKDPPPKPPAPSEQSPIVSNSLTKTAAANSLRSSGASRQATVKSKEPEVSETPVVPLSGDVDTPVSRSVEKPASTPRGKTNQGKATAKSKPAVPPKVQPTPNAAKVPVKRDAKMTEERASPKTRNIQNTPPQRPPKQFDRKSPAEASCVKSEVAKSDTSGKGPSLKVQSFQRPNSLVPEKTDKPDDVLNQQNQKQPPKSSTHSATPASTKLVSNSFVTPKPIVPPRPPKPTQLSKPSSASPNTDSANSSSNTAVSQVKNVKDTEKNKSESVVTATKASPSQGKKSSKTTVIVLKPPASGKTEEPHSAVKPSEHKGPVIQDPFESLRKEREEKNVAQASTPICRTKSAVTKRPLASCKKPGESRQGSAGKRRSSKAKTNNTPDAKVIMRPKSGKRIKSGKKKRKSSGKDKPELPEKGDSESRTYISGIDWHIQTDCADNSDVKAVVIKFEDSSDSEMESPRVVPNYFDEAGTPMVLESERAKLRRSLEKESCAIPGQIFTGISDVESEEETEEEEEEIDVEVVCDDVVFDDNELYSNVTTPKIVGEKYQELKQRVANAKFENMILVAEMKARVESPINRNKVIPETVRAIETFSRSVKQEDLDSMLGSHTDETSNGKVVESTTAKSRQILVKEASLSAKPSKLSIQTNAIDTKLKAEVSPKSKLDSPPKSPRKESSSFIANKGANLVNVTKQTVIAGHGVVPHPSAASSINLNAENPEASETAELNTKTPEVHSSNERPKRCRAPVTESREDADINEMIDEILKSTPDPSLTLSWRNSKKNTNSGNKSMTREDLAKELSQDQERIYQRMPNKASVCPNPVTKSTDTPLSGLDSDNGSLGEEEKATIEKLANAFKNLPLKVTDTYETEASPRKVQASKETSVKGKPPVAPKATATGHQHMAAADAKSPRFIRKHDSYRAGHHAVGTGEWEDMSDATLSEYGSNMNLSIVPDDSLVHSDRAEIVTSRLGRRNSHCSATSAMTDFSTATDDVETIQWKRGNMLGKGAYGTVWCGLTNSGGLIAVKQIELNIDNLDKAEIEYEKIQEEVELLKNLNHKNIVGYLGTSLEDNVVSIFMQFVPGGSIANLLARFGALEEEVFCHYTKQILEGVQYLHANSVIHRDIKGGNIMLMPDGAIKLIDFGCAKRLCLNMSVGGGRKVTASHKRLLKSMRGTPYWMAPEVVKEEGHGTKSDIWSIGCTVFEMATRKPPWADMPPMTAIFSIGSDTKPVPQLPDKFSQEACDFVNLCLTRDQHHRPSAIQMLSHDFILKRRRSKTASIS